MLLVKFRIRTVYNNDEWEDDSGEEGNRDEDFYTSSLYLVNKSLKDWKADEQKFEEILLKKAYNTNFLGNPIKAIKPHYFFPFYCSVHVSEDEWDWDSGKSFFLDREKCINCSYPVLLKRSTDSTLEIVVESLEDISWVEAMYLTKKLGIPTLDVTGYNNLSRNDVYKKYYNE